MSKKKPTTDETETLACRDIWDMDAAGVVAQAAIAYSRHPEIKDWDAASGEYRYDADAVLDVIAESRRDHDIGALSYLSRHELVAAAFRLVFGAEEGDWLAPHFSNVAAALLGEQATAHVA